MVSDLRLLLPAILAFVAVALGTVSLVLIWETMRAASRRRAILKRLQPREGVAQEIVPGLYRHGTVTPATRLELTIARIPRLKDAQFRLQQAGMNWSLQTYLLLTVGASVAFGIATFMITRSGFVAIVFAALGSLLPDMFVYRRKIKKAKMFEEQFPEAIDLLGRAIRAGHPLSAGIRMVAEEAPEPVSGEFRQVFEEQRFGLPFEDALLGLSDRNALVDVRIFVTAVLIQREVGGNLAEILDKISQTVRARFTILRQLRVYTAQGRLSGYVLAVLPIGTGLAMYFINKPSIITLFTEPLGRLLVISALIMQIIGYLWIRKIVNIEI
ncbi:MAG: type II secretion system F family protein [Longimicrobiales bacterium]